MHGVGNLPTFFHADAKAIVSKRQIQGGCSLALGGCAVVALELVGEMLMRPRQWANLKCRRFTAWAMPHKPSIEEDEAVTVRIDLKMFNQCTRLIGLALIRVLWRGH